MSRAGDGRRQVVVLRRRMSGRDPDELHRASTPLELLFDLCFVVAVSIAAIQLHHGIGEGHAGATVLRYLLVFFAIWWAWVNFTWFASAYDTETCRTGCSPCCRSPVCCSSPPASRPV
ncbi:MAG: low temperature requirement [Pseudonocardia sp.]|nr:low temperature requirement [Pseudonocardia sp.]